MKKSIIIYADCIAILEELTYEQAGKLFKAILSYVNEEPVTETEDDPAVNMAFKVLKTQIDRDADKYAEKCEKNRQIAIAREKRRKELREREQTNTNVHEREQTNTNATDNDNDNESTKVDDNKKKETPSKEGGKKSAAALAATLSTVRSIEERQKAFYDTLRPYVNKYPKEMLRAFYDWWSEPNRSRTKLRVELEKTWDLSRRLATWNRKDEERKFNGSNKQNNRNQHPTDEEMLGQAVTIIEQLRAERKGGNQ